MTRRTKAKRETADFLNVTVDLPPFTKLPNWLRIIIQNSSPSPFLISRDDGNLFDRLHMTAKYVPEHEAIIRLLAMVAYQDLRISMLEKEIDRAKVHFAEHILERGL